MSAKEHQLFFIEEHGRILEYIRYGDPYLVRKEMEHHIERSMNNIIESFSVNDAERKK